MEFCMSRKFSALVFLSVLIFAFGCKSKKVVITVPKSQEIIAPTSTELLIKKINSKENSFNYFSAKGQVSYTEKNSQQDFDVSIVMEKDKYIWMNITVLFGIEAVRIKITPDSVIILDRLHRKCIVADYSYLKKISNVDFHLKQLQQIIIGNSAFDYDEKQSVVDTVLSNIIIYTYVNSQKQTSFYTNRFYLSKNILEDRNIHREFTVEYSNPYIHENNQYPTNVNINIRAEKNMDCKFKLSNFVFEKKKESQFSIPGNYEIIQP
jgi:Domain of unknown function (DUF4292)